MRLQRLQIAGFKSFSDRAELAFDDGVTAIVGPNGCGKSNVADAIVWVLGEQSARSLRGERMEDVIFNGSDARKPQGIAEVTLKLTGVTAADPGRRRPSGQEPGAEEIDERPMLDLEATREVEVTRRLYRSGESEYLINGEQCRLKDIHDLLMDTGLGAKAYAIIEQGKIGQILSTRPADRRQIIEEAAGVTKYKARRRAAELKLEAAQQNLARVDDIVFEVEKQRGTLKRQAAKARRYRRLGAELRRWEKVLFARRYRDLASAILASRERLSARQADEAARAARLAGLEADLGKTRIELARAEAALTSAREAAHARELEIDRTQNHIALGRQQHEALGARAVEMTAERETLEARREPARLELEAAREAVRTLEAERDRASSALTSEAETHAVALRGLSEVEAAVDQARGEVFTVMNAATALRHAIETAASARDRVLGDLSRLEAEHDDLRAEQDRALASQAASRESLHRAHEALEATRASRRARESELAGARIEHEWRAREVRSREHELAGLTARLASLEELDAARAGYGDGARLVLAESGGRVRHAGSVADYLEADERYERAVEACLQDLLQFVVVPDRAQVTAGLELTREHEAGRCGFLIDDSAGSIAPEEASAEPPMPGLVPLSAVIVVSDRAGAAVRQAIGQAWIAESLDQAIEASARVTVPVATLAGEVVRSARLVSGGGRVEGRGILATKRQIKALRDRIHAERDALAGLTAEVGALEASIAAADAAVTGLAAGEHQQEKALVGLEAELQRDTEHLTRLAQRLQVVTTERRRAEEERAGLEARQQEAHESIARLEDDQQAAQARLAAAQRRLAEARATVDAASARASEARVVHAGLVVRASSGAADVRRLEAAASELEERLASRLAELQQIAERRTGLSASIADAERQLDTQVHSLEDLREAVLRADEHLGGLRATSEGEEGAIRESRRLLDEARAEVGEVGVILAKAESDLTHLAEACVEAVQATLDEVQAEVEQLEAEGGVEPSPAPVAAEESDEEGGEEGGEPGAPPEALAEPTARAAAPSSPEEVIARLKASIDRLGPVNMMAIEQFDELEQRHEFLTVQRRDLVESISSTGEAIRRIDETSKARFREAFTAINGNFQESFRTLFGGGLAGLALLDEADPLESGIEIVAQPPGKRLQSVQLLSGGEKALTAIALMFAIFRYKPSPFCLLDEIDAPLDDANIGRFVDVLRQMQENTQFILITHSRKTMEIADRLYGVTMEEPGVSKLISVRLS